MRSTLPNEHTPDQPVTIRIRIGGDASTLDPQLVPDYQTGDIIEQLFLALTNINNSTEEVEPELATSWTVSEDGLTWTFQLREDAVWTDGTPVTARDVEYAVKRVLMPTTGAPEATFLYIIKNAAALHQAALNGDTSEMAGLGVKALDDYTVVFALEAPCPFFPYLVSLPVMRPLPGWTLAKHGDAWSDPANIVTNGPYLVKEWQHGELLIFEKNPLYYDADKVQIQRVEVHVLEDIGDTLLRYEAGNLDMTGEAPLPIGILGRVRQDPKLCAELHEGLRTATAYIGFTMTKPPFDNVLVRKAFSAAIDRVTYVRDTLGSGAPTTQLGPRGVFGAPEPQVGQGYDPEQARGWLSAAGYPNGVGFPTVTYRFFDRRRSAETLQAMWKQALNVDVTLEQGTWPEYFASIEPTVPVEEMPHMWGLGMFAVYPDENNFVYETFHCTDSPNAVRAPCTRADELAKAAGRETDPDKRKSLYREVEQLMFGEEVRAAP